MTLTAISPPKRIVVALERIAAALEAANANDPLAMIGAALVGESTDAPPDDEGASVAPIAQQRAGGVVIGCTYPLPNEQGRLSYFRSNTEPHGFRLTLRTADGRRVRYAPEVMP